MPRSPDGASAKSGIVSITIKGTSVPKQHRVPADEARALCVEAFMRRGVPAADAALAAEQFVLCDLFGIRTHGTRRLSNYIGRIECGGINPKPDIRVVSRVPPIAILHGDGGLGTVVASRGLEEGIRRAKANGIAYVGCIDSNHFGANAAYGWLAAREGLVCLSGSTATPTIPPAGGRTAAVGNNPVGYAAPCAGGPPFLLDIAMSVTSRGKLRRARELGETIPEGLGLDRDGRPTTDPGEALEGFMLPMGGHKGYGLALAAEVLAALLSGGGFGSEIRHQFKEPERPSNISHYFLLIDPEATVGRAAFEARMRAYCDAIKATPPADPSRPVRVPGEGAAANHARNAAEGLAMDEAEYARLRGLAAGTLRGEVPEA
jgi:LDH2 family malate/lactate/ureidoglycolate dehydrogenase